MIILKFGGTSVQNAEWIDKALDIAESALENAPVLVASATKGTTNALDRIIRLAPAGKEDEVRQIEEDIFQSHRAVAADFLQGAILSETEQRLKGLFNELTSLITGMLLIKECTPRLKDAILSFGERLSTLLISARALQRDLDTELLDSRKFIKTDDNFGEANVDFAASTELIRKQVLPRSGKLLVCQGFIASSRNGVTTTIGRGGSDYSATIIGAALSADEVQIWTDVDGIMTADPRIIGGARTIEKISYSEAAELAFFGARVIHPSSIQPAIKKGIPVFVRNTGKSNAGGTLIVDEYRQTGVRAIAGKDGITLITVNSSRMLNAYGFLSRIFAIFEKHRISVDLVATSEVSVSMTVDESVDIAAVLKELEQYGTVTVESNRSIICLVGKDLWKEESFFQRVFAALTPLQIEMISLGSSDINLSLVVAREESRNAIRKLHREFF